MLTTPTTGWFVTELIYLGPALANVDESISSSNLPKINRSIPNCLEFPVALVPIIVLFQFGILISSMSLSVKT